MFAAQVQALARPVPISHYVAIPQAGHNAQQENPPFFSRVLPDFLVRHQLALLGRNEEIEYVQKR
jgi:pimeloyl-ACP methyl ester carboxylesterase